MRSELMGLMQAAVVEQFGQPLVLQERDIPSPGTGEISIKTEACGGATPSCTRRIGDWPVKPTLRSVPGNKAIGLVATVGSSVPSVEEEDRVGVPWLYSACRHCESCFGGLAHILP